MRPLELVSHDINDAREGIERRARVEEGQTGAAGENVDSSYSIFVTNCVAYFRVQDWVGGVRVDIFAVKMGEVVQEY